ncbi:hypothetical protein Lal_00016757 [Lupinus albus]|nr:hypothetical protein Lal_00016757 [Lupinus albus]
MANNASAFPMEIEYNQAKNIESVTLHYLSPKEVELEILLMIRDSMTIKNYREIEYFICFLKGFNDQYNIIKSQILLMEPLRTMNKVYSLILQ